MISALRWALTRATLTFTRLCPQTTSGRSGISRIERGRSVLLTAGPSWLTCTASIQNTIHVSYSSVVHSLAVNSHSKRVRDISSLHYVLQGQARAFNRPRKIRNVTSPLGRFDHRLGGHYFVQNKRFTPLGDYVRFLPWTPLWRANRDKALDTHQSYIPSSLREWIGTGISLSIASVKPFWVRFWTKLIKCLFCLTRLNWLRLVFFRSIISFFLQVFFFFFFFFFFWGGGGNSSPLGDVHEKV